MAVTVWFIILAVIAAILLFVASIAATTGAAHAFGSSLYNSQSRVRSAHQSLTIAAALGWTALVVLVVILIVAATAGGFSRVEVTDAVLAKDEVNKAELVSLYRGEKELSSGQTTQLIVIIVLIIVALVTLIVGILSITAAIQLGGLNTQDSSSSTAYTAAVVASVAGVGGIGIMIVAVFVYFAIRSARERQLAQIEAAVKKGEARLGLTDVQLETTTTTVETVTR